MKKFVVLSVILSVLTLFCGCAKQADLLPKNERPSHSQAYESTTEEISSSTADVTRATTKPTTTASTAPQTTALPETTVTAATTVQTTAQDDSLITVSVLCSCRNAVSYGIRDKKNYADFIPENGILFSSTVTLQKGGTAMEAIKAAALDSNVEIKETRGYIRGIGGLYEKDCGGSSGWMYSVNGTFPNVSSDKYQLNDNDIIELHYTVKNGDVA